MRKICFWIAVSLSLLVIVPLFVLAVIMGMAPAWPDPPPGDIRLEPEAPILTAEEITEDNGIFHLMRLENLEQSHTNWPTSEDLQVLGETERAPSTLTNLLSKMAGPRAGFKIIHEATARAYWQHETELGESTWTGWEWQGRRNQLANLGNLANLEAILKIENGNWEEAESLMADQIITGCRYRRGGSYDNQVDSWTLTSIALGRMLTCCATNEVPVDTLHHWETVILREAANKSSVSEMTRIKVLAAKQFTEKVYRDAPVRVKISEALSVKEVLAGLPPFLVAALGSTVEKTAAHQELAARWAIHRYESPYTRAPTPMKTFLDALGHRDLNYLGDDPWGRMNLITNDGYVSFSDRANRRDEIQLAGAAAAMAILRYQRSEGQLPDRLESLQEKGLSVLPKDAFQAGSNLIYRVENEGATFRLYSVGSNQVDDGGTNNPAFKPKNQPDWIVWPPTPWQ